MIFVENAIWKNFTDILDIFNTYLSLEAFKDNAFQTFSFFRQPTFTIDLLWLSYEKTKNYCAKRRKIMFLICKRYSDIVILGITQYVTNK